MAESVVGCGRRRKRMTTAPLVPQVDGTVKRLGGLVQVAPFHLHSTESTERLQGHVEVTPRGGYLMGIPRMLGRVDQIPGPPVRDGQAQGIGAASPRFVRRQNLLCLQREFNTSGDIASGPSDIGADSQGMTFDCRTSFGGNLPRRYGGPLNASFGSLKNSFDPVELSPQEQRPGITDTEPGTPGDYLVWQPAQPCQQNSY